MNAKTAAATGSALILAASLAHAQDSPLARGDAAGMVGSLNVQRGDIERYDDWVNRIGFAGAGAGFYWTDHLKTEIDGGVSTEATRYGQRFVEFGGIRHFGQSEITFSSRRIAIGQYYQFYRNVLFHPHVGGGVDLTWLKETRTDGPVSVYDPATRQSRIIEPLLLHAPRSEQLSRPFAQAGFKAYFARRAFFRSDIRLIFKGGVDEVLIRFGFGADF